MFENHYLCLRHLAMVVEAYLPLTAEVPQDMIQSLG